MFEVVYTSGSAGTDPDETSSIFGNDENPAGTENRYAGLIKSDGISKMLIKNILGQPRDTHRGFLFFIHEPRRRHPSRLSFLKKQDEAPKLYSKMAYQKNESNIAFWNTKLMAKTSYKIDRRLLCSLLVQAREEANNLTQKQVADTSIVSQSEISKIENGQRKVEFVVLLKLVELYGKNVNIHLIKIIK